MRRRAQAAADVRDIVGADNYYCELMDHGIGIERRAHQDLLRLAKELGLPLVATNDLHYTRKADAKAHDALLCIQSGSMQQDENRLKFDADDFYLKPAAEMRAVWAELPEACDNTLRIAERCRVEFNESANYMPSFPVPAGESQESWFVQEVERGLRRRFPQGVPDAHRRQADYEVGVITQMGFSSYFLVTADFIQYARDHGIRVGPGRGSAAGCLVAYALGITDLEPLAHGLVFERFLNPERISMPDVDIDFDERRRGDVIRYVTEKYGEERVAQIVTYGTIKAKQAVKDSARVLGYPYGMGERLTKAMPPPVMGKDVPLAGIFDPKHPRYGEAAEFRQLVESDADAAKVVETARGLENLKRQWGVHAAGVIMSSRAAHGHHPDHAARAGRRDHHAVRLPDLREARPAQDGLPRAAQPHRPRRRPREHRGQPRARDRARGPRAGRQGGIRAAVQRRHPRGVPARRRPDARAAAVDAAGHLRGHLRGDRAVPAGADGRQRAQRLRRPQEPSQAGRADPPRARRAAGRDPRRHLRPDRLPRAGHGDRAEAGRLHASARRTCCAARWARRRSRSWTRSSSRSPTGCASAATPTHAIKTLWDILVPFSDYAFNKAHTAGYGLVSYWTAYLKANYPAEYMAALLTSVRDDKDKTRAVPGRVPADGHQGAAAGRQRVGRQLHPARHRHPVRAGRRSATSARTWSSAIVEARESKGRFADFYDFLRKVDAVVCNKKVVESLIKAGAFDSLGQTRRGLSTVHADAIDAFMDTKRNEAIGQFDLFSTGDDEQPRRHRGNAGHPARSSGRRRRCWRTSGRCSGSTSPTTRCSASSTSWRSPPTARSPR